MPLKISAVGDISLGDHPVCVGHGVRRAFEKYPNEIFEKATPYIINSDVSLANLEGVTSDIGLNRYWLPSYEMRGAPSSLKYIKSAGFSVVGVANNHSLQHGKRAFKDTVEQVKNNGLSVVGLDDKRGVTQPYEIEHDGFKSAIVAYSIRPEEWIEDTPDYSYRKDAADILAEIKVLRAKYDGFIICSIHWGLEFLDNPAPHQVELGRSLVDAGVDVIFGHHPHVIQPVERYKKGLIFYSLGNFVFDLWPKNTKLTGIANVQLEKEAEPQFEFIPMTISDNYCLRDASTEERAVIDEVLGREILSPAHHSNVREEEAAYSKEYLTARREFRLSSYRYFLANILRYPFYFLVQSLGRTALRRLSGN